MMTRYNTNVCVDAINGAVVQFNAKLVAALGELESKLTGAKFIYMNPSLGYSTAIKLSIFFFLITQLVKVVTWVRGNSSSNCINDKTFNIINTCKREMPETEWKDTSDARKVQKADREKLRREKLNYQFIEKAGNYLGNNITNFSDSLSEESCELTREKIELREEKSALKSDIENLNAQYQQRVGVRISNEKKGDDSSYVETELALKTPGSRSNQESSARGKNGKNAEGVRSSSRYTSSQGIHDSSSKSVVDNSGGEGGHQAIYAVTFGKEVTIGLVTLLAVLNSLRNSGKLILPSLSISASSRIGSIEPRNPVCYKSQ
ncbi:hypothetical protein Tco_1008778 [Tanacetum coccineum]